MLKVLELSETTLTFVDDFEEKQKKMRTITTPVNSADWYLSMLAPLNKEVKLDIISRLSASLTQKTERRKVDMCFFDGLNNSWDDGTPVEEEIKQIQEARTSGLTRSLVEF